MRLTDWHSKLNIKMAKQEIMFQIKQEKLERISEIYNKINQQAIEI